MKGRLFGNVYNDATGQTRDCAWTHMGQREAQTICKERIKQEWPMSFFSDKHAGRVHPRRPACTFRVAITRALTLTHTHRYTHAFTPDPVLHSVKHRQRRQPPSVGRPPPTSTQPTAPSPPQPNNTLQRPVGSAETVCAHCKHTFNNTALHTAPQPLSNRPNRRVIHTCWSFATTAAPSLLAPPGGAGPRAAAAAGRRSPCFAEGM